MVSLLKRKVKNRDLSDTGPAGLCLKRDNLHKDILLSGKPGVNDINQARKVLIVLDDLSDKQL